MIQLNYDIFVNFWYHILVQQDVSEPYAVYNQKYVDNHKVVIPQDLRDFLVNNLQIVSHFPFYMDINKVKSLKENMLFYFRNFPNTEGYKNQLDNVSKDSFEWIVKEYQSYVDSWDSETVIVELAAFKSNNIEKFIHALKFLSYVSGIEYKEDLHIWLIKNMPEKRGKSVGFPGRNGFAIAVPNVKNLSDEIFFVGVHELAHYFTDRILIQNGFSLDGNEVEYKRRESLADLVTELYFKDIGKSIVSGWEKEFIPQEIYEGIINKVQKLISGIDITHFGKFSQEFVVSGSVESELVKDIFFIEKRNERVYFFLPLIGRMVGVPNRYFKNFSPIEFNDLYKSHFLKAGLLVARGQTYFKQSPNDLERHNGFVKKVRFHMTNNCNLRCKYCYLSSGECNEIKAEISAEQAIEYLIKLYGDNLHNIEVEFHGGGEPTLMINEIKKIVDYIDSKTNSRTIRLQTNGLFPAGIIDWIVEKKIVVSVSIDGNKEVNDVQRTDGVDVFDKITSNISKMIEQGVSVSTVSVITEYSQDKLLSIYEFIKLLGVRAMMMNPVHSFLGRSQKNDHPAKRDVDLMTFVNNYLEIKMKADKEGVYLVSDFLPDFFQYIPRNYQCDACKAGVGVYANGDVCSCTRAYDKGAGSDNPFVWANIGPKVKINVGNEEKLRCRVTENMPECKHCLLKWNCAGDCLLQCYELNGDMYKVYKDRCEAKTYFIVEYLKSYIHGSLSLKVALIHFPPVTPMLPPPGVNYLANYLINKGIKCEVIDLNKDMYYNHKDEWRKTFCFSDNYLKDSGFKGFIDAYISRVSAVLISKNYTFVGLSSFDNTYEFIKVFLENVKPKKKYNLFLGGPDVYMEVEKYKDFLRAEMGDALILKEGEEKVLSYVNGNNNIQGVITRENINEDFVLYKDENKLDIKVGVSKLNYVSGYEDGKFVHQVIPIFASRGCSSNCSFCSHKILWNGYRLKSVEDVVSEMNFHVKSHQCNLFYFTDMLLNGSPNWLKDFVNKLTNEDKMYWSAYVRIDSVFDKDFCHKLAEAGAVYLSFGIESNSQHVLDVVNKGTTINDNETVIANVAEAGIFIHASFIVGLPEEGVDDVVMTLDYIKRNIWNIDHVEIFFFENLPQSTGYEMSKDYLANRAISHKYQVKKKLYDELIVNFNQIGSSFLSSRQLYSSNANNLKKQLNEFYRKKYTGEEQVGTNDFIESAERIHKFKLEQIKILDSYIERLIVS